MDIWKIQHISSKDVVAKLDVEKTLRVLSATISTGTRREGKDILKGLFLPLVWPLFFWRSSLPLHRPLHFFCCITFCCPGASSGTHSFHPPRCLVHFLPPFTRVDFLLSFIRLLHTRHKLFPTAHTVDSFSHRSRHRFSQAKKFLSGKVSPSK